MKPPLSARERRALEERIQALGTRNVRGLFVRTIDEGFRRLGLSALGSILKGGRFNRRLTVEALYLADSPITAAYEAQAVVNAAGKAVVQARSPRVTLTVDVAIARALDLTTDDALETLGITRDQLLATFLRAQERYATISQEVGAAAHRLGITAILAPSRIVATGTNLVIFPDNLRRNDYLQTVGSRLSRDHLAGR